MEKNIYSLALSPSSTAFQREDQQVPLARAFGGKRRVITGAQTPVIGREELDRESQAVCQTKG